MSTLIVILLLVSGCARESFRELHMAQPSGGLPPIDMVQPSEELSPKRLALTSTGIRPRPFAQGEMLYVRHCADCHGWKGRGNGPLAQLLEITPPLLHQSDLLTRSTADVVAQVLISKEGVSPHAVTRVPPTLAEEDALLTYLQRLPLLSWAEVEQGKIIYDSFCVACHGIYGRGDGLLASALPGLRDLSDLSYQGRLSDTQLHQSIAEGKGAMPASKQVIGVQDIKAVVAFIRILSPGFELYDRFCASCHGLDGRPLTATLHDPSGLPSVVDTLPIFDKQYFRTHTQEHVRSWVWHMRKEDQWKMPHFAGTLDASAVRQVLNYVRTLSP